MVIEQLLVWFLFFVAMSFCGWIVESAFKTLSEHRLINTGFLSGPFVPIYGFGALALAVLSLYRPRLPWFVFWPLVTITPTVLEYFVSWFFEKAFSLRLWDYTKEAFNLNGRVCLKASFYWVILSLVAMFFIQPFLFSAIGSMSIYIRFYLAGAFSMYFILDSIHSSRAIMHFKAFLADLKTLTINGSKFLSTSDLEAKRLPGEIRKLLKPIRAFPQLVKELTSTIGSIPGSLRDLMEAIIGEKYFH